MDTLLKGAGAPLSLSRLSLALLAGACASSFSFAVKAAAAETTLPQVAVTATRTPLRVDETIAEVTVLVRADLDKAAGRSLPELLAQQPGLQLTSNGGLGKSTAISIEGLSARHTLLLIDGVRYGSATLGQASLDNIPLEAIDRIEIVRGPLSSLYGSDAVGGVIQIFTRRGQPGTQANAALGVGSKGYFRTSAGLGFGDGRWDAALQASHVQNKGFSATNGNNSFSFNPDRDGFRQNTGSAQVGLKLGGDWRIGAKLLSSHGTTGTDDGVDLTGTVQNALTELDSEVMALELSGSVMPGWHSVTRFSRSVDTSTALSTASPFIDLGPFKTSQNQITHEESIATRAGTVLLVADYLKQKVSKPGVQYDLTQRSILGFAAGLNGQQGRHTWQASARHDHNSQFGNQDTGAIGYGFDLTKRLRLGASYGTSFVAPSFNDLYYRDAFGPYGDPNLKPEEGKSAEVSALYTLAGQQFRLAYYEHRIDDYIVTGPGASNIEKARVRGLSLSYKGEIAAWSNTASFDHLDPKNVSDGAANNGKILPRRSKNAFKASTRRDFGDFGVGASVLAMGKRFDDAANATKVGGYAIVDLRTEWRFAPKWTMALNLNNLGGRRYQTVNGYNQPGREAYLTVAYSR